MQSKDVIVTWKMYNGFNANKTFWSDSNSLEMLQRNVKDYESPEDTIAGNYYPVTSAIAMRSKTRSGKNVQVTVMNDRTQGGSADIMGSSTIELMQHRRHFDWDEKGNAEAVNETDTTGEDIGIKSNARYYMQIFNTDKGKSLQRQRQIETENPLSYFFIFDFEEG